MSATMPTGVENPFPGLRSFEPTESDLYFGRDEEIDQLLDRLDRTRFLAVVGTSGCGKSSLVRAGLIPALRGGSLYAGGTHWEIVVVKPGSDPNGNLVDGLAKLDADLQGRRSPETSRPLLSRPALAQTLDASSMGLVEAARAIFSDRPHSLLVVVDQFEEIFRFARATDRPNAGDEAKAFVRLLLAAAKQDLAPVYVVLTMRSEFLGHCAQFRDLPEALNDSQFLVPRLTRGQMKEAIEGPAGVRGAHVAPRLVQQALNDVGDDPDQLPILQHALKRMWHVSAEARAREEPIDLEHYKKVGEGLQQALNQHVEEIFNSLTRAQQEIARKLFQQLVERGPEGQLIRRPTSRDELQKVAGANAEELETVIESFGRTGRTFLLTNNDLVDISHESLIRFWTRLTEWVQREETSAEIYGRLADAARRRFRVPTLYGGPELSEALQWLDNEKPTAAWAARYDRGFGRALRFLRWSRVRRNTFRVATGVVAAVVLFAPVYALWSVGEAQRQTEAAALATSAKIFAAPDPSLLLTDALGSALRTYPFLDRLEEPGRIKDALQLAVNGAAMHQETLGRTDRFRERFLTAVTFSPDGACVATWGYPMAPTRGVQDLSGGRVTLWRTAEFQIIAQRSVVPIDANQSLVLDPSGRWVALLYPSGHIEVFAAPDTAQGNCASPEKRAAEKVDSPRQTSLTLASAPETSPGLLAVALAPGRPIVATASWDGTVSLWDIPTRRLVRTLEGDDSPTAQLTSRARNRTWDAVFDPTAKLVATAHGDNTVKLFEVDTGRLLRTLTGHRDIVRGVAFNPRGDVLATASWDDTIRLWDVATGASTRELKGHTKPANAVAFDPSGDRLASAASDGSIRVWDVASGQLLKVLTGHTSSVRDVTFSPDGASLASASADRTARIWEVDTGKLRSTFAGSAGHTGTVWSVAFNRQGTLLVTSGQDGVAKVWDVESGRNVSTISERRAGINEAEFNAAGNRIITVGNDDTCRWWDWQAEREDFRIWGHEIIRPAVDAAMSPVTTPDRQMQSLVALGNTGEVWVLDTAGQKLQHSFSTNQPGARRLRFSPDGARLATVADKTVEIWNTASWSHSRTLPLPDDEVLVNVAFNQDGTRLAAAGARGKPTVWDLNSGELVTSLTGNAPPAIDVALSPSGALVAAADRDGMLRVWNVQTGLPIMLAPGSHHWVAFTAGVTLQTSAKPSPSTQSRPAGDGWLLAIGRDGSRARYGTRDFYEPDVTRLIGRAFRRLPGTLNDAIGLALEGDVVGAINLVQELEPSSDEWRKADALKLLDKLRARTFTPLDLQTYFAQ